MIAESLIDQITAGFLECAEWADKPENSRARFPSTQSPRARAYVVKFVNSCLPLAWQALDCTDGYSPEQFGRDVWLTQAGHGCGFWDRPELEQPAKDQLELIDRNGKPYTYSKGATLGDALTAAVYGTDSAISPFAYRSLSAYRGWLYLDGSF